MILPRLMVVGFFQQCHDVIVDWTANRMRQGHLVLWRLQEYAVIFHDLYHPCRAEGMTPREKAIMERRGERSFRTRDVNSEQSVQNIGVLAAAQIENSYRAEAAER